MTPEAIAAAEAIVKENRSLNNEWNGRISGYESWISTPYRPWCFCVTFVFNKLRDKTYLRFSVDSPSYIAFKCRPVFLSYTTTFYTHISHECPLLLSVSHTWYHFGVSWCLAGASSPDGPSVIPFLPWKHGSLWIGSMSQSTGSARSLAEGTHHTRPWPLCMFVYYQALPQVCNHDYHTKFNPCQVRGYRTQWYNLYTKWKWWVGNDSDWPRWNWWGQ